MDENTVNRDPIEELATEFTDRCRRGEEPTVDEYALRFPELATDIRELFPMIRQVEQAKDFTVWSGVDVPGDSQPPERLGDFRIIRELGRGGMGIVYEAEQESLGRRVAIKVLPQEYISSESRRLRFEQEARTAAKLHHTNIVQIFGVGEQEGRPYFVMQCIRGVGLDAVFRRLAFDSMSSGRGQGHRARSRIPSADPVATARDLLLTRTPPTSGSGGSADAAAREDEGSSGEPMPAPHRLGGRAAELAYWRSTARLFVQAADALSFAHRHGVLHRDIKPANLLLDADGRLWVADFGLAKADDSHGVTQAGDFVGTIHYMAPERFDGRGDSAADIYSLGITLYEMATLRPAFVAGERPAVMKAILEEPLYAPQRLCPTMPSDLETIILKAAARDPLHRYESAAALRDDLQRFVDDRPILARRVSALQRLRRWARRNPALAVTTGIALGLLFSIAVVSSAAYLHVRKASAVTRAALDAEKEQRRRVEATADLAVGALDRIFDEFAPVSPSGSHEFSLGGSDSDSLVVAVPPALSPETAGFLKGMLQFYRGLAQEQGDSPALLLKMASAQCRVAQINHLLGQYADARTAYADSISQYERLREVSSSDARLDVALARAQAQLGEVLAAQDDIPQAFTCYDAARRVLQAQLDAGQASDDAKFELARACYLLSRPMGANTPMFNVDRPGARQPEGPPRDRAATGGDPRGLPGIGRPGDRLPQGLARGLGPAVQRGAPPGRNFRWQGRVHADQAIETLMQLSKKDPKAPRYRHLLALCLREPPPPEPLMRTTNEPDLMQQAVTILEQLVSEFPNVPQYRFDLSETYAMDGGGPDGIARLRQAERIMRELIQKWPNIPAYAFSLGHIHLRMAHAYLRQKHDEEALQELHAAIELQTSLVRQFPSIPLHAMTAALYELAAAQYYEERSRFSEARPLIESAVARMEVVAATDGHKPHVRRLAAQCFGKLAGLYHEMGEEDLSREVRQKAGVFAGPPATMPDQSPPSDSPPGEGLPPDAPPPPPSDGGM